MVVGAIERQTGTTNFTEVTGLIRKMPWTFIAALFAIIALAGIPPLGGFIGKWMLLDAALQAGQWWWVIIIILGGLLAAAYVFKVIGHCFTRAEMSHEAKPVPAIMEWSALALAMAAIMLGLFASWPLALMDIGSPFDGAGS